MAAAVVLVHGAWHGAWCWDRVVARLTERGLRVVAPDLPGHGADDGEMTDLHGDAARVVETLEGLGQPVVLVGHSYGGAVITEAGDHQAVQHLIFLGALVLDADESCMEAAVTETEAAGVSWEGRPNLAEGFIAGADGSITLDPVVAARCLYNDCDDESVTWALARIGPHPLGNLEQRPMRVAWRTKPSTYAVCAEDMAVHPDLQRVLAKRCTSTLEWPTGHSPFVSRPDLVVDLVEAAAR